MFKNDFIQKNTHTLRLFHIFIWISNVQNLLLFCVLFIYGMLLEGKKLWYSLKANYQKPKNEQLIWTTTNEKKKQIKRNK